MDGVFEVNTSEKLVYTGSVHCMGYTGKWHSVRGGRVGCVGGMVLWGGKMMRS